MKVVAVIAKILTVLAAAAGAIYLLATYGEQIVEWCKKTLASLPECPCTKDEDEEEIEVEIVVEEPVAEEVVEEVPVEEASVEDVAAEVAEVVAEEVDFEG